MDRQQTCKLRAKKLYEDVSWTHKMQAKQCDLYEARDTRLKILSIVLVALTSSGIFSGLFLDNRLVDIASAVLAFVSLFVTIDREARGYEARRSACEQATNNFLPLRAKAEKLYLKLCCPNEELDVDEHELDLLQERYALLCSSTPPTSAKSKTLADKAKASGEMKILVDDDG
ncbi:SLATT domain-containing protein [Lancefieldella rimae]|uniref:SLATT domain-containing protein n=1 Tax=Lancefieldella rimae TaxID=1383 RepID=UPI0028E79547|nr:SLATT domain-containing protein [Lancefieldella rimae]